MNKCGTCKTFKTCVSRMGKKRKDDICKGDMSLLEELPACAMYNPRKIKQAPKKTGRPHDVINDENMDDQRISVVYMIDVGMIALAQKVETAQETDSGFIDAAIIEWLKNDPVFVPDSELRGHKKQKNITIKISTKESLSELSSRYKKTAVIESAIWCEANRRKGSAL